MTDESSPQTRYGPKGLDYACPNPSDPPIILPSSALTSWQKLVWARRIMENLIRNAIIKFEQEFMGRGPDEVRAFVVRSLVVVRLKGVLTPAERQLAKT